MYPSRVTVILTACVFALICALQGVFAAEPVRVPHSQQWTMYSAYTGREHEVFVAIPETSAPPDGYAVIYVLDGNSMFLTTVDAVRAYARRRDAAVQAHALVVGIGYPEGVDIAAARAFDLTPDVVEPRSRHPSGGAEAMMAFIVHELKPEIATRFQVNPAHQALIGHSLGGRLTLDMLTGHTDAFQHYVAMSASFWFGQHDLVRRVDAFVKARHAGELPPVPARVLLTVGEFEQQPRPDEWRRDPVRAARQAEDLARRGQIDHARNAASTLAGVPGIEADFQEMVGEDHGTVVPAAIGRAVRFILVGGQEPPSDLTPVPANTPTALQKNRY